MKFGTKVCLIANISKLLSIFIFFGMAKYTLLGKYVRYKRTTQAFALQTRTRAIERYRLRGGILSAYLKAVMLNADCKSAVILFGITNPEQRDFLGWLNILY